MSERRKSLTLAQTEIDSLKFTFEKELSGLVEDDGEMSDLLNFTVAMIQNGKTVVEMEKELDDIYGGKYVKRIGSLLMAYFGKKKSSEEKEEKPGKGNTPKSNPRLKKLKSSGEGNALTMSGALGASREGSRTSREDNQRNDDKKNMINLKVGNHNNNNKDDRGSRSDRRKNAFDRLTTFESRERHDKRKNERDSGRGDRAGGRNNQRGGRGCNEEGGRISGYRRCRDADPEMKDSIPTRNGGGRGGRSYLDRRITGRSRFDRGGRRGRGGRGGNYSRGKLSDSPNKRQRVFNGEEKDDIDGRRTGLTTVRASGITGTTEENTVGIAAAEGDEGRGEITASHNQNNNAEKVDQNSAEAKNEVNFNQEYNELNFFEDNGYDHGGYRGSYRGRGRYNHGFSGSGEIYGEVETAEKEQNEGGCNEVGEDMIAREEECDDGIKSGHNSFSIATGNTTLCYSGRGYGRIRGRGFYRGGRGRGRVGNRTNVANLIASKAWVRKKDEGEGPSDSGLDARVDSSETAAAAVPTATAD
mmetsp:Transcript_21368/g.24375  ORF Transcript_21368/g.24375 Transcript_21368/m.24375 type:complete len:529 (+) Transcript_21368:94-1680(+)|eukprot:CAMPEP_0194136818 /NCGR_PEP_ID=MMETSP0152-20130528/6795_1 /TAXON_ID=1049557 /ORGANISM="Thalassiothrix antarctica, Strain L6-D1" /LENGTH=528 /DNA_ID=CAMNT_0038833621 /DNA_START=63 /DNA_END=1649 /DNA_ORIENTATION=-